MSKEIRRSINETFGFDAVDINSALVSAQNRQRLYWVGKRNKDGTYSKVYVDQPEDKGIVLRDILETETGTDLTQNEKAYCLTATYNGAMPFNTLERKQRTMVAEPVAIGYRNRREKDGNLYRRFETSNRQKSNALTTVQTDSMVAEPINVTKDGKSQTIKAQYAKTSVANICCYNSAYGASGAAEPVRIGDIGSTAQAHRVYSCDGKSVTLKANAGGQGGKTGLYACHANDTKQTPIYEVKDGKIKIKGKEYPIKLKDGYYIIRKLTVKECMRLQTIPEWYDFSCVSKTQAYKMLGNGWTCDVITHLIKSIEKIFF